MAKKITIELDHDGIRALLLSAPVAEECKKAADAIAARAGKGFIVVGPQERGGAKQAENKGRVGYGVAAGNYAAMLSEAENKTLSKAVR